MVGTARLHGKLRNAATWSTQTTKEGLMPRYQIGSLRKIMRGGSDVGASLLRHSLGRETSRTHDRHRSCQRYRFQPGGCVERSRSSEAARNHQPITALSGNAENVWSALSGLYRKRAEDRPIGISASQSISHSRNLRATPHQTDHSTVGEISTLSRGIEGCRGVVSGTTQGERSEEGENR
jgi:hypothetical protein